MRQGIPTQEWFKNPENVERYRKWRDSADTQMFVGFVQDECRPMTLPTDGTGRPCIELSGHIHGQHVGEHRSLNRLMSLDAVTHIPEDIVANYNAIQYLMDRGYSEDDAIRIMKESESNG